MHTRHKKIVELLQRTGFVSLKSAAELFDVTEMTIRRDMKFLSGLRVVLPVKNGMVVHPASYEPENSPLLLNPEKFILAEKLYNEIMPAERIFLGTGFTVLAFAKVLARKSTPAVTVVTNSLAAAAALFRTRHRVFLLGGELRQDSMDLVGETAAANLSAYKVDYLISGCDAASPEFGFYTSDDELSRMERYSLAIAGHTVIVAESHKFDAPRKVCFATPGEVDILVTDKNINAGAAEMLRNSGVKVVIA